MLSGVECIVVEEDIFRSSDFCDSHVVLASADTTLHSELSMLGVAFDLPKDLSDRSSSWARWITISNP